MIIGSEPQYATITEVESGSFVLVKKPKFATLIEDWELDVVPQRVCIADLAAELYCHLAERWGIGDKYLIPPDSRGEHWDYHVEQLMFVGPIVNAELHGHNNSLDKTTYIQCSFSESTDYGVLEVTVTDQGPGFDHAELVAAEATARESGIREGFNYFRTAPKPEFSVGYALFNCIRYCDSVTWNQAGNEMRMKKRLYTS
jgi:anti-sigma regulatory factor (Ser/Thr protein kinase)